MRTSMLIFASLCSLTAPAWAEAAQEERGKASSSADRGSPGALEARARRVVLQTYFHGVDDRLARERLGAEAVPVLRRLLAEPEFPRRDNVVAFLARLDGGEGVPDLMRFLAGPPAPVDRPEEDRALLLAPQALGLIARRSSRPALDALLAMTAPEGEGGDLARAAARGRDPHRLLADLVEMALRGLALSCAPEARERLVEIAGGHAPALRDPRDLRRSARDSQDLYERECGAAGESVPSTSPPAGEGARHSAGRAEEAATGRALPGQSASLDATADAAADLPPAGSFDPHLVVHDSGVTYANHPNVSEPMTDVRLDGLLQEASLRAGRADFAEDVACCITLSRSGSARSFGTPTDGLDIIDNGIELSAVLDDRVARVKVVRAIHYCGGVVLNASGCAHVGGNGIAVVRISFDEAGLWIHEFGHNTGLRHNPDNRYIMYKDSSGSDNGLTQEECDRFHDPDKQSKIEPVATGACTDLDGDLTQDGIDNCPLQVNFSQADLDADGAGDACDADRDGDGVLDTLDVCPGVADPGQEDSDGDRTGDACDNCPALPNIGQADADGDQEGDVCDVDDGILLFTEVTAGSLAWQPERTYAGFDLYRGDLSVLRSSGAYTQDPQATAGAARFCGLVGSSAADDFGPAPGAVSFHLVTGEADGVESSLGTDSAGSPRLNSFPCSGPTLPAVHLLTSTDTVLDVCSETIVLSGLLLDTRLLPIEGAQVTFEITSTSPAGLSGTFAPDAAATGADGSYTVSFMLSAMSCTATCVGPEACLVEIRATAAGLGSNTVLVTEAL